MLSKDSVVLVCKCKEACLNDLRCVKVTLCVGHARLKGHKVTDRLSTTPNAAYVIIMDVNARLN